MATVASKPKKTKGKTAKAKAAKAAPAPAPEVKPLMKRLDQMRQIGESIREKDADLAKQNAIIATVKSKLETERDLGHEMERELETLHGDLANLAVGKFIDRLPFPEPEKKPDAPPANTSAAPVPQSKPDHDAWKSVKLADVWAEVKANVALLALLADGKIKAGPQKGQVANIKTLGDLTAFTSREHAKLTDISGIGPEKEAAISDATVAYWAIREKEKANGSSASEASTGLVWHEMSDSQHFAETATGIRPANAKESSSIPQFVVSKAGDGWSVDHSAGCLMPEEAPATFMTLAEARAWCQRREDELKEKVAARQVKAAFEAAKAVAK